MKNNKIPIDSFRPKPTDKVLLDTNILLDLFYPLDFESTSNIYESLFNNLIKEKSHLLISSIQVSEFINRCIRFQFKLYQNAINNPSIEFKKDYRSTDDYHKKMNAILDIVKTDISHNFTFIDDGFSQMNPQNIFLYGFSYDFNDSLLVEIARQHNAILITNDADYANYNADFQIVTSNRFLLMSR